MPMSRWIILHRLSHSVPQSAYQPHNQPVSDSVEVFHHHSGVVTGRERDGRWPRKRDFGPASFYDIPPHLHSTLLLRSRFDLTGSCARGPIWKHTLCTISESLSSISLRFEIARTAYLRLLLLHPTCLAIMMPLASSPSYTLAVIVLAAGGIPKGEHHLEHHHIGWLLIEP
jgi:hypothetical protein